MAFIASNDSFFVNFAKWAPNVGTGTSGSSTASYLRAAWTPGGLISGFDSAVGVQIWNGTGWTDNTPASFDPTGGTAIPVPGTLGGIVDTKASAIDAQLMGDVSGMPLLAVASYAKAPKQGGNLNPNLFNGGTADKHSFNIAAELGVIPNKATVQFGIRRASSGNAIGAISNATDNAILLGGTYNIALNARMELTYTKYSGDMYNAASAAAQGTNYMGDTKTTLDLAFGF